MSVTPASMMARSLMITLSTLPEAPKPDRLPRRLQAHPGQSHRLLRASHPEMLAHPSTRLEGRRPLRLPRRRRRAMTRSTIHLTTLLPSTACPLHPHFLRVGGQRHPRLRSRKHPRLMRRMICTRRRRCRARKAILRRNMRINRLSHHRRRRPKRQPFRLHLHLEASVSLWIS
jgi:hypothetical protein